MNTETTRAQIMQHAKRLIQERGYNGFSYRDLATLAADLTSLPERARRALQDFYRANEDWLTQVLAQGVREGSMRVAGDLPTAARSTYAALQGSLVSARLFNNNGRVEDLVPATLAIPESRDGG